MMASNPFSEWRMRRIGHQFVVLDEINSRFTQDIHQLRGLLRRQADAVA
jgi:hypothetical protein